MGTVYTLPVVVPLENTWSGWINQSSATSQQLADYNTVKNNGLNYYYGATLTQNSSIHTLWIVADDVVRVAYFKYNTEIVHPLFYAVNACNYTTGGTRTSDNYIRCTMTALTPGIVEKTPTGDLITSTIAAGIDVYENYNDAYAALSATITYPITYHYTNSAVSGPLEAAIGDTVTVSAVPDVDYGITDASTQILVTNNDVAVPYTWDAANNRITFTMPDPS